MSFDEEPQDLTGPLAPAVKAVLDDVVIHKDGVVCLAHDHRLIGQVHGPEPLVVAPDPLPAEPVIDPADDAPGHAAVSGAGVGVGLAFGLGHQLVGIVVVQTFSQNQSPCYAVVQLQVVWVRIGLLKLKPSEVGHTR